MGCWLSFPLLRYMYIYILYYIILYYIILYYIIYSHTYIHTHTHTHACIHLYIDTYTVHTHTCWHTYILDMGLDWWVWLVRWFFWRCIDRTDGTCVLFCWSFLGDAGSCTRNCREGSRRCEQSPSRIVQIQSGSGPKCRFFCKRLRDSQSVVSGQVFL